MLNTFTCTGNLVADPELRATRSNHDVGSARIAINQKLARDREVATFIDIQAWDKTAKLIHDYFKKGDFICLQGQIRQDNWEDRETGQKRSKLFMLVEKVIFLPRAKSDGGQQGSGQQSGRQEARRETAPREDRNGDGWGGGNPTEDDLPF